MARYFALIGPGNVVQTVIVAPSAVWCMDTLGGWWEETIKGHSTERFAAKGRVFVPSDPRRFLTQEEVNASE